MARLDRLDARYRAHHGDRRAGRHPETDATHLQLFTPGALRSLLAPFEDVEIRFAVGRYMRWSPRLMARVQAFSARKPG